MPRRRRVERAVVLAAGLGTRLKWLTDNRPKAMMPVGGTPAIVHVLRQLAAQGIRDVAVNVHHHGGLLMRELGDGARFGVRLSYSVEEELLDSGGGVRQAMALLPEGGLVAVHNADVLADIDLQRLAGLVPGSGAALALVPNPGHNRRGDFALRHGLVVQADERPFTFAGVSVWEPSALAGWQPGEAFGLIEPMRQLMATGRLAGMLHRGRWFDIGRPRDLFMAARFTAGG